MEGITASVYKGLKEYWGRRGYERINGSGRRRRNRVELGSSQTRKGGGRFWRWRIKLSPKIRFHRIPSPKKLLLWARDAYVRMMLGLANSRVVTMSGSSASAFGGALPAGGHTSATGSGLGLGTAQPKEYDERMLIQIYKSLLMAHGHLVPRDAASTLASQVACRR